MVGSVDAIRPACSARCGHRDVPVAVVTGCLAGHDDSRRCGVAFGAANTKSGQTGTAIHGYTERTTGDDRWKDPECACAPGRLPVA